MISTFSAVFDANVFYGARLRSLILFLAQTGLFRARWSHAIHDEWIANLLANRPDLQRRDLEKTRRLMDSAVLDCLIFDYEALIPSLTLPDKTDRHVLAAAIRGGATVIVTFNGKDFPDAALAPHGLHARHPDEFLLDLFGVDEGVCMAAVQDDIAHYKEPMLTVADYLISLEKAGVPQTAAYLRERQIIFE